MQGKKPLSYRLTILEHGETGGDVILMVTVGFILGVLIGFMHSAMGQEVPRAGASYIGMCSESWPCARSLDALKDAEVKRVGLLMETFHRKPGACPCLKRFLATPGEKYLRIHLTNGTCFRERGRICGRQELFYGLSLRQADRLLKSKDARLLRRFRASLARSLALLPSPLPEDLTLRLSPTLESPFSAAARRVMLREVEAVGYPKEVLVDSVLTQKCLPGYICEKHGAYPKVQPPCITDTDGVDFLELDLERHAAASPQCEARFLWHPGFNLLEENPMKKQFIDPLKRRKAPSRWSLLALAMLLQGR
jgi:hypothetical protein